MVEVTDDPGDRMTYTLRPNLPVLGPRFGQQVGAVRNALGAADPAAVVRAMRAGEPVELRGADGSTFTLTGGEILVTVDSGEGWSAAEESGYAALMDIRLNERLDIEGRVRDIIRNVQRHRQQREYGVSDRIKLTLMLSRQSQRALESENWLGFLRSETLATSVELIRPEDVHDGEPMFRDAAWRLRDNNGSDETWIESQRVPDGE